MRKRVLLGCLLALAGCAGDLGEGEEGLLDEASSGAPAQSTNDTIAEISQALGAKTLTVVDSPAPNIGDGYDSVTESMKRRCITPSIKRGPVLNVAQVAFQRSMTETEAESALGISGSAKASFGIASINGSANFSRWTKTSSRSMNMVFRASAITRTDSLITTPVQPLISQANWRKECGDQFVQEIMYGGELFVVLRIDFATEAERTSFEANVGGSWLLSEAEAKVATAARSFKGRAAITVDAFQRGGRTGDLSAAVGLEAITCSIDNLTDCTTFMKKALEYARGTFSTSIRTEPAAIKFTVNDWTFLSLGPTVQDVPLEIKSARKSLMDMYRQQVAILNRYSALVASPYYAATSTDFKNRAFLFAYAADSNKNLVLNSLPYCFEKLSNPVQQGEGSLCVWFAAPEVLKQAGFADVNGAIAAMDVKLQPLAGAERFDLVSYETPGEGHFGSWTVAGTSSNGTPINYKMCPTGTFAIGYAQKIESWLGEGEDDTGLNSIELTCGHPTNRSARTPTRLRAHEGFFGDWFPQKLCSLGPMTGMRIDIEPRQFDGDDTAADNVVGSCLTGEQIQAAQDENISRFGKIGNMAYCRGGTAVCGIRLRIEGKQGSGDDTGMNGLSFACCAL